MRKTLKKSLSVLLAVVMMISAVPLGSLVGLDLSDFFVLRSSAKDIPSGTQEFNGHYYAVIDVSKTWTEAEAYCETLGDHLATITSQEEQDFINSLVSSSAKKSFWLGATDSAKEGTWVWVTNEPFSYTNWERGEPNNNGTSSNPENYLEMRKSTGEWNDGEVNGDNGDWALSNHGIICEWEGKNEMKNFSQYSIKIVDDISNKPVKDCQIVLSENEIQGVNDDGLVTIFIKDVSDYVGKKIKIISSGYDDYEFWLSDLNLYKQNVIKLSGSSKYYVNIQDL